MRTQPDTDSGGGGGEMKAAAEFSGACSHCPSEEGCGSFEVCRIMSMSDEEIIATTPDAEAVAAEMRAIVAAALAQLERP